MHAVKPGLKQRTAGLVEIHFAYHAQGRCVRGTGQTGAGIGTCREAIYSISTEETDAARLAGRQAAKALEEHPFDSATSIDRQSSLGGP